MPDKPKVDRKTEDPKAEDPKAVPPNPELDAIKDQPPLDKPTTEEQDLTLDWAAATAVLDDLETNAIEYAAEEGAEGGNPHVFIRNNVEPFRQAMASGYKNASIFDQIMAMQRPVNPYAFNAPSNERSKTKSAPKPTQPKTTGLGHGHQDPYRYP
jgi:hypothetical protein